MGSKTRIALLVAILAIAVGAVGAYAYDSSQNGKIAEGITIGGVDVGGLDQEQASALVRRELLSPLQQSLTVTYGDQDWTLPGKKLKVRAEIDRAIDEAVESSRSGGLPARLVRYVSGSEVEEGISADVAYSERAVNRFVRRIAADVNREPRNASVEANADALRVVAGENGRKLRDNLLTDELKAAVLNASAPHEIVAHVRSTSPEVSREEVAGEYPTYLTLDRSTYTLRFWRDLELAKTYTVAVGQEGLETPEGLYSIQDKQVDPTWHVPDSDWAGDLAGQVIPPGPSNPLKARWMGIYEGAGIHGTDDDASLGSAASHGCVRMAVSDVEELYDLVEVGTPIYIG